MKAKTLKLKTIAIASVVTIAGCTLSLTPNHYVIAAEAPAIAQATAKMTNAQLYDGLEITQDSRYIAVHNEAFGTATAYYLPNRLGYSLDIINALTADGTPVNCKFFKPYDVVTNWGHGQNNTVAFTGSSGSVGSPAEYALTIWSDGTTASNGIEGDMNATTLQQLITAPNSAFTGYTDLVDEGAYIRLVYSISFEDKVGYYCAVENKATKAITSFQYVERADLYDDTRALTVIYSCLPQ